jgi:PST family polysaccharide transporter
MAPAAPEAPDPRRLDRSLLHGIAWTGAVKWFTQALSWVSMLVVARLLKPSDFGLVGAASVFVGLVNLVSELGLSAAIVQRRDLSRETIAQLGGLSILFGVLLTALSCIFAVPIAGFFRQQAISGIVAAMSFSFITGGVQVLPRALLQRDLKFRHLATADGVRALVATVATITLAATGFTYWSLVLSNLLSSVVASIALVLWRPHPIAWPREFARIRSAMTMGWQIVVSRLAWYGYSNADFTVVGRVMGPTQLGHYSVGWTIASIPVERISALVGRVLPGLLSAVQDDLAALRRYVLLITEGLAFLTFPASIGIALVADDLVAVALGPKWAEASLPLRLLCFYAGFRSICTIFSFVLVALNRARISMYFSLLALAVLPPMFLLGTRWGAAGVAAAWIVGYPLVMIPVFRTVFHTMQLRPSEYLRVLWPSLRGTGLMAIAVLLLQSVTGGWAVPLRLALQVAAGAAVYIVTTVLPERARLKRILDLVRRRGTGPAVA